MSGTKKIASILDLRTDLAATHRAFYADEGNTIETLKAQISQDFELVQKNGYVVIDGLLSASQLDIIRNTSLPMLGQSGRNNFEGERTQRLYNVLEKTRIIDTLTIHPRITALLNRLFLPNYLLSQAQIVNILPGEVAQPLHYDDGFYPISRPRPALGAATVWAIDEFTEENGATLVIPQSHQLGGEIISDYSQAIPMVMPAGSVVFFLGTLWHGGGANRSGAARLAATCQYCEPWLRTQENFSLGLSPATLAQLPERLLAMLGYSIHPPFMGMVNGMHPKRTL
jgi:ectoine hydroxylase-related dioxygenase (phytanoyl-CoA dioxygenase family)